MSNATDGHPRQTGHGGEFWKNVAHWKREQQTTSVCLPWEPHEQYERQMDRTLKDELTRSVGALYATVDQWRHNSTKNEETEPKQKQYPVADVTGDGSKVRWCREQYCKGTWNVRSRIKANWKWSNRRWLDWTSPFSVQFSSVACNSLQPYESQHARPPCPSPTSGAYSNSCPSSWWCHPAISSSVIPFSSCPQSLLHQGVCQWACSSHEVAKVLEFQLQHQSFQWTPRTDLL